jgi:hypothetical protein
MPLLLTDLDHNHAGGTQPRASTALAPMSSRAAAAVLTARTAFAARTAFTALALTTFAALWVCGALTASAYAQTPQLKWGEPVECLTDNENKPVRVQCKHDPDLGGAVCLVAPNRVIGGFSEEPARTWGCSSYGDEGAYQRLIDQGFRMIPALVEAPPGWGRDARGRTFQVTFDLLQRFYIGASWQPTFDLSSREQVLGRSSLEVGGISSWYSSYHQERHEVRFLEGSLRMSDLEARGLLLSYDMTARRDVPLLWITTFIGEPKRFDIMLDLGWGMRLLNFVIGPRRYTDVRDVEWGELHMNWTLWKSHDLYNQVRLELGGDLGTAWDDRTALDPSSYIGATAALRGRFTLGQSGLHFLTFDAEGVLPYFTQGVFKQRSTYRMTSTIAYEVIPLAIVDQPLSLRVAASADYREDLSSGDGVWETTLWLGGRFSLWAPPLERTFE